MLGLARFRLCCGSPDVLAGVQRHSNNDVDDVDKFVGKAMTHNVIPIHYAHKMDLTIKKPSQKAEGPGRRSVSLRPALAC